MSVKQEGLEWDNEFSASSIHSEDLAGSEYSRLWLKDLEFSPLTPHSQQVSRCSSRRSSTDTEVRYMTRYPPSGRSSVGGLVEDDISASASVNLSAQKYKFQSCISRWAVDCSFHVLIFIQMILQVQVWIFPQERLSQSGLRELLGAGERSEEHHELLPLLAGVRLPGLREQPDQQCVQCQQQHPRLQPNPPLACEGGQGAEVPGEGVGASRDADQVRGPDHCGPHGLRASHRDGQPKSRKLRKNRFKSRRI